MTTKRKPPVQYSIDKGDLITRCDRQYRGRTPVYTPHPSGVGFIKMQKGIPFVRVTA